MIETPDHVTWLHHALIAVGLLPLIVVLLIVLPRWSWPGAVAGGLFLFREVDQHRQAGTRTWKQLVDRVMDVAAPTAAGTVGGWLGWLMGVRW